MTLSPMVAISEPLSSPPLNERGISAADRSCCWSAGLGHHVWGWMDPLQSRAIYFIWEDSLVVIAAVAIYFL